MIPRHISMALCALTISTVVTTSASAQLANVGYTPQPGGQCPAWFTHRSLPKIGTTFVIETTVPCLSNHQIPYSAHWLLVSQNTVPSTWLRYVFSGQVSYLLLWPMYNEVFLTHDPWVVGRFSFPIPNDARLVGTMAYFQLYAPSCEGYPLLTNRMDAYIGM